MRGLTTYPKISDVVATSLKRRGRSPRRSNLLKTKFCLIEKGLLQRQRAHLPWRVVPGKAAVRNDMPGEIIEF